MEKRILVFVLTAFIFSTEGSASEQRRQKLEQMRSINRSFQIYLGRSATKSELQSYQGLNTAQLHDQLEGSAEYESLFLCRVSEFIKGGMTQKVQDCRLPVSASSKDDLNVLLPKLMPIDHKLCQSETSAHCFSKWLSQKSGLNMISSESKAFDSISYADLMLALNK